LLLGSAQHATVQPCYTNQPAAGLRDQLFANLNQRPEAKDYGKSQQEPDMITNSFRRESIPGGHLQQAHAMEEW
jgi:hypothetical protein